MDSVTLALDPSAQRILTGLLALMMFSVALDLRLSHFQNVARQPFTVVVGLLGQHLILPLVTLCLTLVLDISPSIALGMIVVAACPGGNVSNFLTSTARGDTALSVTLTAFSSVFAVLLTPLSIVFWSSMNPAVSALIDQVGLNVADFLIQTTLMLAVPLILGMTLTHYKPTWSAKANTPLRFVSFLILIIFIVGATTKNWGHLITFGAILVPVVVFHNFIAFSIGYLSGWAASKRAQNPTPTLRAITFEIGIQNSGLGLVILLSHFNGLGGAALITAAWGVWHIVSGLGVAALFRTQDKLSKQITIKEGNLQ